jgi:membrane-associated protease RseP (regulator of RpoE activity)
VNERVEEDEDDDDPPPSRLRTAVVHGGLFLAACATTCISQGPAFAATLMAILTVHELGHYVVARSHKVDASLPYFIPLPPFVTLGTLGAVIKMKRPIADPNKLLDVGAAGPLAGLVVAIPLLVIGLSLSSVGPIHPDGLQEGNSILYGCAKLFMFGRWLPGGGLDVDLHPVAFAAWMGLLVTMINLIPIGQLDGGHVARAWLGDRHEAFSARLHVALPVVGVAVAAFLWFDARGLGAGWLDATSYALQGAVPWLVWTLMLGFMRRMGGGVYHPPVGDTPLTPGRRWLAVVVLVVWALIFTPIPTRPTMP